MQKAAPMVGVIDIERRTRSPVRLRAEEPQQAQAGTREKPAGVAQRSAGAPATRTATDSSAAETRTRLNADPAAQQMRARAEGALVRSADAPRTKDPGPESAAVCGPGHASDADYQRALSAERDLSRKRQELGRAQQELENRGIVKKGWDWLTDGDKDEKKKVDDLKREVKALEEQEKSIPKEAVEQARFTVFNERLAELEKQKGKGEAARLARQTYYNSGVWNGAAGTKPASEGEINAAGFPHGEYNGSSAVGGYGGEMRTRDGQPVDMGHVACALDWQVNQDRAANTYGNPFDKNAVTVSGDVASAMVNTPDGPNAKDRARQAIAREGDADWNGDIDGNNLAKRLESNPNASLADTVRDYYDSGAYRTRVDEWATHSKYVEKDASGQPKKDAGGHYVVNKDQLQKDAGNFAKLLGKGEGFIPGKGYAEREVVDAFQEWLDAHQNAPAVC